MAYSILKSLPADYKGMWIGVYQPISGWKAIQHWWNPDMDGFWEPWQTGMSPHATREKAVTEAKFWAMCEDLPFVDGAP